MSTSNKYRNYLEGWVGTKPATASAQQTREVLEPQSSMNTTPLVLTGSSYLMPTLRLDRRDDPATLQIKIENSLSGFSSPKGIHSMLRRKPSRTVGYQWSVPIVLDLAALIPDGSHHYRNPEPGLLIGVVRTLRDFGIIVVGVINTPHELEMEAIQQLGLPLFPPKGFTSAATLKVGLDDVIHMVLRKHHLGDESDFPLKIDEMHDQRSLEQTHKRTSGREQPEDLTNSAALPVMDTPSVIASTEHQPQVPPANSYVYFGSVRSGQQVAADKGQALVVIGSVNSGGEVLSDGDIYIFGKLRGRALAGLACAHDAKIITTSFDPELICIGDAFTTVDDVSQFGLTRTEVAAMVTLSPSGALKVQEITV